MGSNTFISVTSIPSIASYTVVNVDFGYINGPTEYNNSFGLIGVVSGNISCITTYSYKINYVIVDYFK